MAEVSNDILNKLSFREAVVIKEHVYSINEGVVRGTEEGMEALLTTRAMYKIAAKLCEFSSVPNKRLEASIMGFTLMDVQVRNQRMRVVMRAPLQKPLCNVIEVNPILTQDSSVSGPDKTSQDDVSSIRLLDPGYIRSGDTAIKVFGGEY